MAQPVLLETQVDLEPKTTPAAVPRPRPRPVAASAPVTRGPDYSRSASSTGWARYADWWMWGAAILTAVSLGSALLLGWL